MSFQFDETPPPVRQSAEQLDVEMNELVSELQLGLHEHLADIARQRGTDAQKEQRRQRARTECRESIEAIKADFAARKASLQQFGVDVFSQPSDRSLDEHDVFELLMQAGADIRLENGGEC